MKTGKPAMYDGEICTTTVLHAREESVSEERKILSVLLRRERGDTCSYAIGCAALPSIDLCADIRVIEDVAVTAEEALHLFTLLADGRVFPYNLEEVLSDLLAETV